jgi:hypothetical protein
MRHRVAIALVLAFVTACGAPVSRVASGARLASPPAAAQTSCVPTGSGYASGARTSSASPMATETPSPVPADAGSISGHLSYPSDGIIAQLVYAVSTDGPAAGAYSVETVGFQSEYTLLGMRPGDYFVYSAVRPIILGPNCTSAFGAGYTNALACGLHYGCDDHRSIPVTVRAGTTTSGIDVVDWYAPTGPPPPPPAVVPDARWPTPTIGPFPTARQAIDDSAPYAFRAQLVDASRSSCPINRACVSLTDLTTGEQAAYMVVHVGSNANVLLCTLPAYNDAAGWHAVADWICRSDRPFPAVGQTGRVTMGIGAPTTDCVNVRDRPGVAVGRVLACLRNASPVRIDGGPAYVMPSSALDDPEGFWWHIQGQGWMAHDFLRRSP